MSQQKRVLCVDDDALNREILRDYLEDEFELEEAVSGEAALIMAQAFRPDVILLDIMMKDLSGYEVCRRLRADRELGRARIILVSAKAMKSERVEGYEAGADDYVTKPFEADELIAKVRVFAGLEPVDPDSES